MKREKRREEKREKLSFFLGGPQVSSTSFFCFLSFSLTQGKKREKRRICQHTRLFCLFFLVSELSIAFS